MRFFLRTLSLRSILLGGLLATVGWPLSTHAARYVAPPPAGSLILPNKLPNFCTNPNTPCPGLAWAVFVAQPNETIFIDAQPPVAVAATNITVNKDLTFVGTGASRVLLNAQGNGRHFNISENAFVRMSNLELINGSDTVGSSFCVNQNGASRGGGSICNEGRLLLFNCRLNGNAVTTGNGGAIYNDAGDVVISASVLDNNSAAGNGGGIYNGVKTVIDKYGQPMTIGSHLTVTNYSTTLSNTAENDGGGIYVAPGSTLQINAPSALDGNRAENDGGAIFHGSGNLTLRDITFDGNSAGNDGGAIIYVGDGPLRIEKSAFTNNEADQGGALFNSPAEVPTTITQSSFENNTATTAGGAVLNRNLELDVDVSHFVANQGGSQGGAIVNREFGNYSVTHSSFEDNSADLGGAIYDDTDPSPPATPNTITASTFTLNSATFDGGAIFYIGYEGLEVVNATLSENTAGGEGGAFWAGFTTGLLTIANATFYDNAAPNGETIYTGQPLTMNNSIVTHNDDPLIYAACSGPGVRTGRGNLVGRDIYLDPSCGSSASGFAGLVGVSGLDSLKDNGGPTVGVNKDPLETHALLVDASGASNAIGAGWNGCPDPAGYSLAVDQRNQPRPGGGNTCDVGAFELQ